MSKIKELLKDNESVLVFDIDGVLAVMKWGKHNHFIANDAEWNRLCNEGVNTYTEDKVSSKMQKFLQSKDMSNIYVITVAGSKNEIKFKKDFVKKYYNIPREKVYCVKNNKQKVDELITIRRKYPYLKDYQIIMIDDTVDILNDVMEKTEFSTAHVSSFLDI